MKYFPLLAFLILAGCETPQIQTTPPGHYTKLVVTDQTGDLVAEWIAEGRVKKTDQGYDIHAVERLSGPPDPISTRYPNGRDASVVGPNIVLETVAKPDWLKKLDQDAQ